MRDLSCIEFYHRGTNELITRLDVPLVPREGETVCIRNKWFSVGRVQWAVDHADRTFGRTLRACVELEQNDQIAEGE